MLCCQCLCALYTQPKEPHPGAGDAMDLTAMHYEASFASTRAKAEFIVRYDTTNGGIVCPRVENVCNYRVFAHGRVHVALLA